METTTGYWSQANALAQTLLNVGVFQHGYSPGAFEYFLYFGEKVDAALQILVT